MPTKTVLQMQCIRCQDIRYSDNQKSILGWSDITFTRAGKPIIGTDCAMRETLCPRCTEELIMWIKNHRN